MATELLDKPAAVSTCCPGCGSSKWQYNVTYTTVLNYPYPENPLDGFPTAATASAGVERREQTHEELRCHRCGKKASIAIEQAIRDSEEFMLARMNEEEGGV